MSSDTGYFQADTRPTPGSGYPGAAAQYTGAVLELPGAAETEQVPDILALFGRMMLSAYGQYDRLLQEVPTEAVQEPAEIIEPDPFSWIDEWIGDIPEPAFLAPHELEIEIPEPASHPMQAVSSVAAAPSVAAEDSVWNEAEADTDGIVSHENGLSLITERLARYRDRYEVESLPAQEAWQNIQGLLERTPCTFSEPAEANGKFVTIRSTWTFHRNKQVADGPVTRSVLETMRISANRIVHTTSDLYLAYRSLDDPRIGRQIAAHYDEDGLLGVMPVKISSLPFVKPQFPHEALAAAARREVYKDQPLAVSLTARMTGSTDEQLVQKTTVRSPQRPDMLGDGSPATLLDVMLRSDLPLDAPTIDEQLDGRYDAEIEADRSNTDTLGWLEGFLLSALAFSAGESDADTDI